MVTELVETSRLWGRTAARIEPEWAEPLAGHLVRRTYSEPHWDSRRGAVMALERVTLYGLPIVTARRVGYARVDPEAAREMFIQHALVEGDWTDPAPVLPPEPGAARPGRGTGAPGPAARPRRRRPGALRLLRPPDPGPGDVGAALRQLVEEDAGRDAGAADVLPRPGDRARGGPDPAVGLSGPVGASRCRTSSPRGRPTTA